MKTITQKSRIRETTQLLTDAESSTNAIRGWTKNTPKPDFFFKQKKIIQKAKTQKRLELDGVAPLMTDPPPTSSTTP